MLGLLQTRIQGILGEKLIGLYLTGSLMTGDFDEAVSDLDLVAVTLSPLDPDELEALRAMHEELAATEKRWENRIEVVYLTTETLRTFRTETREIAVTSPGEPFHTKAAGKDWLINWYVVREKGVALLGPPPSALIDPISQDELLDAVRDAARFWRERIDSWARHRNAQVYAILTLCRAIYTYNTGDYASKLRAAEWAARQLPTWAPVIRRALTSWREDWYRPDVDYRPTYEETVQFVRFACDQIAGG